LDQKVEIIDQSEKFEDIKDFGRTIKIRRSYLTFSIPFQGFRRLFSFQPSTFSYNPPRAVIHGNEIRITILDEGKSDKIKSVLDREIQNIQQIIGWQKEEIDRWNNQVFELVRAAYEGRKEKLLRDINTVSSLGFPMRKSANAPSSYSVPIKKRIGVARPQASGEPYEPHPVIEEQTYQDILQALHNMALVMERSPSSFQEMKEEDLRTHFLVHLNGAFEAEATGETFNHQGKTDILLRQNKRNLFIGECKFWSGDKNFSETIDQLLGYLTWRDSKTALIIFARTTKISTVQVKSIEAMRKHPNFISESKVDGKYDFRCRMRSARDESVSLDVCLQIYDVPNTK
jgi:hypothetical protein